MNEECSVCNGKWQGDDGHGLCPICTDFGPFESIDHAGDSIARQKLECPIRENDELRKKIDALLEREEILWRLIMALCSPDEHQMDPMNQLLCKFLSGPWAN